jgi:hypothetical protein
MAYNNAENLAIIPGKAFIAILVAFPPAKEGTARKGRTT